MPGGSGGLSLADFSALNDEITALVRAGLPLDRSLAGIHRGRLGAVMNRLSERLQHGETLEAALRAEEPSVPPLYAAVVRAGVRSGRLPSALEGLAELARTYTETRRTVGMALLYPVLVLLLGYTLFVGFLMFILPKFLAVFHDFGLPVDRMLTALAWLGYHALYWVPILPVLLVLALALWWRSGRAAALPGIALGRGLGWLPGIRGLLKQVSAAGYADLLALLIEHNTPLPEALALAGDAAGSPSLAKASRALAEGIAAGAKPEALAAIDLGAIPASLRWLILRPTSTGASLAPSLRHAAKGFRRRAALQTDLIRAFLPTLAMLAIGALAALLYALTLFLPFTALLKQLTGEIQ